MISEPTGLVFMEVGAGYMRPQEGLDSTEVAPKAPVNDQGNEKDEQTTQSDGEEYDDTPPMTINRFMSLLAMTFLWTGSQIPLYLFGQL